MAVFLSSTVPAPAEEPLPTGTLSGRVVDPDGKPLVGVKVSTSLYDPYHQSATPMAEARTGGEGRFRLGPVAPFVGNRYDLIIDTEGFTREYRPPGTVSVFPGSDTELGEVRAERGRVFIGRAVDEDGRPRPGASVTATVSRYERGHTLARYGAGQSVTTDGDGRFRTAPLSVGHLTLTVRAEDRRTVEVSRPVRPGGEEDIGEVRLENDVPFSGHVVDEEGRPVEGARVVAFKQEVVTDNKGVFTFHGLGPETEFLFVVRKDGYVGMVFPAKLAVVAKLLRQGIFEGRAVDDGTGEPVRPVKVALSAVARKPDGGIESSPARSEFEVGEGGQFRVTYPSPGAYKLTVSAAGYDDADALLPRVEKALTVEGVVVRLRKTSDASPASAKPWRLVGTVTRDGRPVPIGWASFWPLVRPSLGPAPESPVRRGRTVVLPALVNFQAPIRDGAYTLEIPAHVFPRLVVFENFVIVHEPGRTPTLAGPVALTRGQESRLDIASVPGGVVRGRVKGEPAGWEGRVWVIAFGKSGVYTEARVAPDGSFTLPPLPPGEYGLKAGHDAYEDAETYPGLLAKLHPESSEVKADPWKRARVVRVEAGRDVDGVEVDWPQ